MRIALVIGHEPKSQGAKLRDINISEFSFWWTYIHFALLPRLKLETGHEYKIFTRTTREFGYRKKMIALHKEIDGWEADLAISFHFNASYDSNVGGYEILYSGWGPSGIVAKLFLEKLELALPLVPNRGIKKLELGDRGYNFVKLGRAKALIVEPFFGTNKSSLKRFYNVTEGFIEFFKELK